MGNAIHAKRPAVQSESFKLQDMGRNPGAASRPFLCESPVPKIFKAYGNTGSIRYMKNDRAPSPSNCKTCRENPGATSHPFLCETSALKIFEGVWNRRGHPAHEKRATYPAFRLQGEKKGGNIPRLQTTRCAGKIQRDLPFFPLRAAGAESPQRLPEIRQASGRRGAEISPRLQITRQEKILARLPVLSFAKRLR